MRTLDSQDSSPPGDPAHQGVADSTHRVRLSERREPMKFKSLLLVLMFTLTSATWPQAAPSQAPASASGPTPSAQHQEMMEMHKQQMEAMKADVEKMKSSLAQMKANLLTIKD